LDRNDVPQLAICQIVAFFVGNKNGIKLIIYCGTLVEYHLQSWWYQIASLLSARNVNVTGCFTCSFMYRSLSTRKTGQRIVCTSFQLTFQCGVLCNISCIVRSFETLTEVRSVMACSHRRRDETSQFLSRPRRRCEQAIKVLRLGRPKSGHSTRSDRRCQLLKRLAIVIRAQDSHAEFRLNWNVYNISVNCEFEMKCM